MTQFQWRNFKTQNILKHKGLALRGRTPAAGRGPLGPLSKISNGNFQYKKVKKDICPKFNVYGLIWKLVFFFTFLYWKLIVTCCSKGSKTSLISIESFIERFCTSLGSATWVGSWVGSGRVKPDLVSVQRVISLKKSYFSKIFENFSKIYL